MFPSSRRRAALAGLVPAAALFLAACGNDTEPEADLDVSADEIDGGGATVRVGYLPTESFAPLMIAAEMFAADYNLDVEVTTFPSGGEIMATLTTGGLEVGGSGIGASSYTAHDQGLPFDFVAPQHAGYPEDYFTLSGTLASSEEEAAEVAEDLTAYAGESFATNAPGVATEWMLGYSLERAGLSMAEVDVVTMPFPDMVPALASGAIAGGTVSDPAATRAEEDGSGFRPWPSPEDTDPVMITGVVYNSNWAEDNPDQALAFMAAYVDATEYLLENGWKHESVLEVVAEATGLDVAAFADTRTHHVVENLEVDFDQMRTYQDFFLGTGSLELSEPIDDTDLWNFSWRDAIYESR